MGANVIIRWFSRGILVAAAACIVLAPTAAMAQQHATTICGVANFLAQPGTAAAPTMYAYSTLTLTKRVAPDIGSGEHRSLAPLPLPVPPRSSRARGHAMEARCHPQ